MIRRSLSITAVDYEMIKAESKRLGISMSELVRIVIRAYPEQDKKMIDRTDKKYCRNFLMSLLCNLKLVELSKLWGCSISMVFREMLNHYINNVTIEYRFNKKKKKKT
jgi:hypothetical protein